MDKWQALQAFWASFDLPAYDETVIQVEGSAESAVTFADMPYVTYEAGASAFDEPSALTASLWYYSQSWAAISRKADEISAAIGLGGKLVKYDNGAMWVKRGVPFAQRMSDENANVRRIVLNVEIEFLSEN